MPRINGAKNYAKDLLLRVIEGILPVSNADWKKVASSYQELSEEPLERDPDTIKHYFIDVMCNRFAKVTGSSGPALTVRDSQTAWKKIQQKTNFKIAGGDSDFEDDEEMSDDELAEARDGLFDEPIEEAAHAAMPPAVPLDAPALEAPTLEAPAPEAPAPGPAQLRPNCIEL